MATSNFLPWNPTAANQENDSAYLADSQRVGGAPVGSDFPSATANKLFYQVAIMAAAIAEAMVASGISASDTSQATLAAAFLRAFGNAINIVTFSATPTFDVALGTTQEITLSNNVTSSSIVNVTPGQVITFIIHQNIGGKTFVWPGSVPGSTVAPTASTTSIQAFKVDDAGVIHPFTPMTVS